MHLIRTTSAVVIQKTTKVKASLQFAIFAFITLAYDLVAQPPRGQSVRDGAPNCHPQPLPLPLCRGRCNEKGGREARAATSPPGTFALRPGSL